MRNSPSAFHYFITVEFVKCFGFLLFQYPVSLFSMLLTLFCFFLVDSATAVPRSSVLGFRNGGYVECTVWKLIW